MVAALTLAGVVFTALCTVYNVRQLHAIRTPSGDPIGEVVERTHDLAAAASLAETAELERKARR